MAVENFRQFCLLTPQLVRPRPRLRPRAGAGAVPVPEPRSHPRLRPRAGAGAGAVPEPEPGQTKNRFTAPQSSDGNPIHRSMLGRLMVTTLDVSLLIYIAHVRNE